MTALTFPKRADYEPHVLAFLPGTEGENLQLRASLLLMRDAAAANKPVASEFGWACLDVVERLATRFAFQPMPINELRTLRGVAMKLVSSASELDAVFSPQLPMGEADARV